MKSILFLVSFVMAATSFANTQDIVNCTSKTWKNQTITLSIYVEGAAGNTDSEGTLYSQVWLDDKLITTYKDTVNTVFSAKLGTVLPDGQEPQQGDLILPAYQGTNYRGSYLLVFPEAGPEENGPNAWIDIKIQKLDKSGYVMNFEGQPFSCIWAD